MKKAEAIEKIGMETQKVVKEAKRKETRKSTNARLIGLIGIFVKTSF